MTNESDTNEEERTPDEKRGDRIAELLKSIKDYQGTITMYKRWIAEHREELETLHEEQKEDVELALATC